MEKNTQKYVLKAVPCQRAKNLFDVGLKSIYFYKKTNLEKLFTGPGKKKYFDLGYFEKYLHMTPYQEVCSG